jgi:hypothetical protein
MNRRPPSALVVAAAWIAPAGRTAAPAHASGLGGPDQRGGNTEATAVDGVGEDAFTLAGHLYVRDGAVSIDVYSRGDSDTENLSKAKRIAWALIPKL